MRKNKELIFGKEHKEFLRLWHSYHSKYKIPYGHDDRDDFFLKLTLIFNEGHECQDCRGGRKKGQKNRVVSNVI